LFEVTLYAAAVGFFIQFGGEGIKSYFKNFRPLLWPLGFLAIGLMIGVAVSAAPLQSLGIVKGWFFDPLLLCGFILVFARERKIGPAQIVWPLAISTLPISALAIYQALFHVGVTVDGRSPAWFASPNYLALYLVPILLLTTWLFVSNKKPHRAAAAITFGLGIIAVGLSYSYGGWIALAAGLIVLALTRWPRFVGRVLAGAFVLAAAAFVSQLNNPRFVGMLNLANRSSASVRLQVWATDLLMIKEHWLTGIGIGQYSVRYLSFASRIFSPPLETAILQAHNFYLQFAIDLGIFGWLFLIALGVVIVRYLRKAQIPGAVLAAGTAILAHGLIDAAYWKNDLSVVFWVIVALILLGYNQAAINSHS